MKVWQEVVNIWIFHNFLLDLHNNPEDKLLNQRRLYLTMMRLLLMVMMSNMVHSVKVLRMLWMSVMTMLLAVIISRS